jgi:rare lipoprotein A
MLFNFKKIFTSFAAVSIGFTPLVANASSRCTFASHYGIGDGYHGQRTANGERFNAYGLSTAHRSLPFGTRLRVTNQVNGKSVIVYVNDRGPYVSGRSLDLSYGAFTQIASAGQGVAQVCYSRV